MEQAAVRLRHEYVAASKGALYEQLTEFRWDSAEQRSYAQLAQELGLSESAVKSAIYRLRRRHQELVREGIALTVDNPGEVDEEIRHLLRVITS